MSFRQQASDKTKKAYTKNRPGISQQQRPKKHKNKVHGSKGRGLKCYVGFRVQRRIRRWRSV